MIDASINHFIELGEVLGLKLAPVELSDGSYILQAHDKVDTHNAYKKNLEDRIGNLEKLVRKLEKEAHPILKDTIEKLRIHEEIFKLKRQLLDLVVEYMARDSYHQTWSSIVKTGLEADRENLKLIETEMPLIVKRSELYVQENSRPFTKISAEMAGHIAQHHEGYPNDRIKIKTYQRLKALLNGVDQAHPTLTVAR